jgi:cell division protein DivIC
MLRRLIRNKYPISLTIFVVWMFFFDTNSIVFMYKQYNELKDLKMQEEFLQEEIVKMTKEKEDLFSNNDKLEKYARENFYFKKDNEDVYVIEKVEEE